jgi:pimeloyl-ACP methyl ester carboxylesterase
MVAMPHTHLNEAKIYYEEHGSGSETIVFSHGLLWSGTMFHKQIAALKGQFRCIIYDHRGQGQSEVTASGYDMDILAEDAAALIKALDCAPCHFVGLSMGGFVAMRLGIRHPELVKSLLLLGTSADPEPEENVGHYKMLNFVARWFGLRPVANQVMPIMFGQKFLNDAARTAENSEWRNHMIANHRIGITRAVNGVIYRQGVYDQLHKITAPTLVIVGDQDVATVPAKAERIHAAIAGSQLVKIPGAGHTSSIEEPEAVNAALQMFLNGLGE